MSKTENIILKTLYNLIKDNEDSHRLINSNSEIVKFANLNGQLFTLCHNGNKINLDIFLDHSVIKGDSIIC